MLHLMRLYEIYAGFFSEVGALDDFRRLIGSVVSIRREDDYIGRLLRIGEVYGEIEEFYRRHRKHIPPTILTRLRAELTDIIEATPLTP